MERRIVVSLTGSTADLRWARLREMRGYEAFMARGRAFRDGEGLVGVCWPRAARLPCVVGLVAEDASDHARLRHESAGGGFLRFVLALRWLLGDVGRRYSRATGVPDGCRFSGGEPDI